MQDLGISGWELEALPDDAQLLTDVWVDHLKHRDQFLSDRVQKLKQQTLIHQKIFG
jgi:polysaccharide pyruvyl transferase WcaK-like protein